MAWAQLPPEQPAPGWWTELAERQAEANLDRWVEEIADGLRAERIERLKAAVHKVDMAAAGALSADRWARFQWRHELRYAHDHHGYQVDSWGAGYGEVEHGGGGRILDVR